MKYLTDIEVRTLLNLGKTVEMFLGKSQTDGSISWVSVHRGKENNFELSSYSVFDDGDIDHLDIYDFEPVDPDNVVNTVEFEIWDGVLEELKRRIGSNTLRFVNQGMVQEEYRVYKERERI